MAIITSSGKRLAVSALVGVLVVLASLWFGFAKYAALLGWDSAALTYVVSVLVTVLRFDARKTREHALSENPGRVLADVLLLTASVVSLVAVGVIILQANSAQGFEKGFDIALGLFSVIVSWAVVHTLFLLRYARLYYGDPEGGIDFNQTEKPRYSDFAYLAFTIGMTFQVSDTEIKHQAIRATILRHALLAYVFGTVVIATTINMVVSLSSSN